MNCKCGTFPHAADCEPVLDLEFTSSPGPRRADFEDPRLAGVLAERPRRARELARGKESMGMPEGQKQIGYVEAVVRVPLYEKDVFSEDSKFDWFQYAEPGIEDGRLGVCRRDCKTVSARVVRFPEEGGPR